MQWWASEMLPALHGLLRLRFNLNFLSFGTRHMRQNNSMRPNALLKNDIRLPFALTTSADISQTVKSKRSRLQSCSSKTALPLSRHSRV
jgi:hypothetical protein